ncbi:MAG TPA: adenylate/guanylate cyclase domain-containing protein [Gaiellaceae bacterium]|nr:adenylate/guanylate cyclase domain-containing protein [Gaiellaceae bacterium]
MIACAQCGFENAAGRKFCGSCGSPLAVVCGTCGAANEPGMRFCGECGSALAGEAGPPATGAPEKIAERRLVSVLFADLVGFTPSSESRDPEEVRELLSRYFDTCRRLIGIYGGTVEKFIGDAVMAVWGTPTAQEDDAERAVRTALDLVSAVAALGEEIGSPDLALRAGVLTGEAAVNLAAEGEGMVAGDLVNTAARVQAAAAPGTVLVGDATRRATAAAIAYEPTGEHELKGKAEPVSLFRALRITSFRGGARVSSELEPPFVGRARELRLVKEHFHGSAEERKAHLVSVVGIAGIGKSRLAWEFEKYLDGVADEVLWHRGRCLAYGDGVAYWALAEMVRMRALIAEEDTPEEALAKLRAMLEERVADASERTWLEPRLAHLLGLAEHATGDRQDLFSAWRLFFERLAERSPVLLVFEDLQWADSALLDFVEHLLEWSHAHPLFVLALARPELAERRSDFGASGRNATTLSLEPLSSASMEELLDGFVPGLPDDLRTRILERAEGVPLYAVETVRMLLDRGLLTREGDAYRPTGTIEALEVPETLHALVAARLDGLGPEERRVLQDAAVLGKSFTKGGLAALSGLSEPELEPLLSSLVRKEVLSVQSDPRSPERGQYAFLQDLLKQIAYETLARADRKAKHLAAAEYLESATGRAEQEAVEVVAAHYFDAYEAARDAADAPAIRRKAAERLALAGDRAASLAASEEAQAYFEKAATLAEERLWQADLIERAGLAAQGGGRYPDALALYERAIELYRGEGDRRRVAHVTGAMGITMGFSGDLAGGAERMEEAFAALADDEPGPELAELAEALARHRFFLGDYEPARERVERALEIAEALVLPDVLVHALNTKHLVLGGEGRYEESLALLEHAIELGRAHELGEPLDRALYNLSYQFAARDRLADSAAADLEGIELARRRGDRVAEQRALGHLVFNRWDLGEWDEVERLVAEMTVDDIRTVGERTIGEVNLGLARGDVTRARNALEAASAFSDSDEVQTRAFYRLMDSFVLRAEQKPLEALAAAREALARDELTALHPIYKYAWVQACEVAFELGDQEQIEDLLGEVERLPRSERTPRPLAQEARFRGRLLALRGDREGAAELLARAVEGFRALQTPYPLAIALAEQAELGVGDPATLLAESREIFERLGATPWLERLDALQRAVAV